MHNIGSLRALVEPAFLPTIFLPYDRLLAHGQVMHDRAVDVSRRSRRPGFGRSRSPRTTSCSRPDRRIRSPRRATRTRPSTRSTTIASRTTISSRADRVLLVGAGPVGIELAGEIVAKWPDKHVTLLDVADDVLGERFVADLRAELRLAARRSRRGARARRRPARLASDGRDRARDVHGDDEHGSRDHGRIWFQCFGVTPESDYLERRPRARPPSRWLRRRRPALQVAEHDNVFAIGDVSTADAKMAGMARMQATLVAREHPQAGQRRRRTRGLRAVRHRDRRADRTRRWQRPTPRARRTRAHVRWSGGQGPRPDGRRIRRDVRRDDIRRRGVDKELISMPAITVGASRQP